MAELGDALVLGASGATRESSSLSFRTISQLILESHDDLAALVPTSVTLIDRFL